MKKAILWLSIVALVLGVVGLALYVVGGMSALSSCGGTYSQQVAAGGCANSGGGIALIGLLLFFVGCVCGFIAWILALIKTATLGAWGWFVVALIVPFGVLAYGIAGPDQKQVAMVYTHPGAYPPSPGQPQ